MLYSFALKRETRIDGSDRHSVFLRFEVSLRRFDASPSASPSAGLMCAAFEPR